MTREPTEMELRCMADFAEGDGLVLAEASDTYRAFALDRVRRVTRAMREPMKSMYVGHAADCDCNVLAIWQDMIDAASPPEGK